MTVKEEAAAVSGYTLSVANLMVLQNRKGSCNEINEVGGRSVGQVVKALRYKPEGRGIDTR
jgi:hypothetical protein